MFTRQQYMNHEVSHDDYFNQFVTPAMVNRAKYVIENSVFPWFSIPLKQWDAMSNRPLPAQIGTMLKNVGEWNTLSTRNGILKAAAKTIIPKTLKPSETKFLSSVLNAVLSGDYAEFSLDLDADDYKKLVVRNATNSDRNNVLFTLRWGDANMLFGEYKLDFSCSQDGGLLDAYRAFIEKMRKEKLASL